MELRAGSTVVRDWVEADAAAIVPLADDREVWLGLRDAFPHPYRAIDAHQFIARARRMAPRTFCAIDADGRLAGGIGYTERLDVERIGAEVGYWLGREFWGRGIATAALQLLTRYAFETNRELRRLWAVPFATNVASARVLEKAGYQFEGRLKKSVTKDGQTIDQLMYAVVRD